MCGLFSFLFFGRVKNRYGTLNFSTKFKHIATLNLIFIEKYKIIYILLVNATIRSNLIEKLIYYI